MSVSSAVAEELEEDGSLSLRKVYDFALTAPLEEIDFILDSARLNKAAAEASFKGDYGHSLGKSLRNDNERRVMGDSVFTRILSYTSGACDARMAGAMIPVMSNSVAVIRVLPRRCLSWCMPRKIRKAGKK